MHNFLSFFTSFHVLLPYFKDIIPPPVSRVNHILIFTETKKFNRKGCSPKTNVRSLNAYFARTEERKNSPLLSDEKSFSLPLGKRSCQDFREISNFEYSVVKNLFEKRTENSCRRSIRRIVLTFRFDYAILLSMIFNDRVEFLEEIWKTSF